MRPFQLNFETWKWLASKVPPVFTRNFGSWLHFAFLKLLAWAHFREGYWSEYNKMFDLTEDKPKLSVSEPVMLGRTYERCWMNKVEIKREWIEVFSFLPWVLAPSFPNWGLDLHSPLSWTMVNIKIAILCFFETNYLPNWSILIRNFQLDIAPRKSCSLLFKLQSCAHPLPPLFFCIIQVQRHSRISFVGERAARICARGTAAIQLGRHSRRLWLATHWHW